MHPLQLLYSTSGCRPSDSFFFSSVLWLMPSSIKINSLSMSFLITSVWSKHPLLSLHVQFYNFPIDHNALLQIKPTYLYIMFWIEQTFTDWNTAISWEPALIEKALGMATKVQGLIVSWWEMIVRWLEGDLHTLLSCKDKSWSVVKGFDWVFLHTSGNSL